MALQEWNHLWSVNETVFLLYETQPGWKKITYNFKTYDMCVFWPSLTTASFTYQNALNTIQCVIFFVYNIYIEKKTPYQLLY